MGLVPLRFTQRLNFSSPLPFTAVMCQSSLTIELLHLFFLLCSDGAGATALHYACDAGLVENVVTLLNFGASLECVDDHGDSALHYACIPGVLRCVQELVNRWKMILCPPPCAIWGTRSSVKFPMSCTLPSPYFVLCEKAQSSVDCFLCPAFVCPFLVFFGVELILPVSFALRYHLSQSRYLFCSPTYLFCLCCNFCTITEFFCLCSRFCSRLLLPLLFTSNFSLKLSRNDFFRSQYHFFSCLVFSTSVSFAYASPFFKNGFLSLRNRIFSTPACRGAALDKRNRGESSHTFSDGLQKPTCILVPSTQKKGPFRSLFSSDSFFAFSSSPTVLLFLFCILAFSFLSFSVCESFFRFICS
jgi:hypothetical protein